MASEICGNVSSVWAPRWLVWAIEGEIVRRIVICITNAIFGDNHASYLLNIKQRQCGISSCI